MCKVWENAPSLARVIQDVDRFLVALRKIIAAEGCYVEEFDARHGHRRAMQKAVKGGGVQHYGGGHVDRDGDGGDAGARDVVGWAY